MRYWIIVHDRPAFIEEPRYIGKNMKRAGKINKIQRGDKVLYYSRGESVIINSYDVITNGQERRFPNDEKRQAWKGNLWCYRIRPRCRREVNAPIQEILEKTNLKVFPDKQSFGKKLWSRTSVPISKSDFTKVEKFLKGYKPKISTLFRGPANEGNLGEPMDLEILNYAPTSEQGVVVLFAAFMKELPYNFVKMEFVRSGFPDACVLQKTGNTYSRKYIEFEFRASSFRAHVKSTKHRDMRCDYVVCWENDYPNCPAVEVIELKSELQKLMHRKRAA